MRQRSSWLGVLPLALLGLAMSLPAAAWANPFVVDSIGDQPDLAVGGGCLTAEGKCTLRAAIEEANAASDGGQITFDEAVFDGQKDSTIVLGSGLPAIEQPTRIDGGQCTTAAGVAGPCVAVNGTNSSSALKVEADGVEIEGLAILAASEGIRLVDADDFGIRGNWFGVELDGDQTETWTGTAVLARPGSDDGRVGGKEPGEGNLFVKVESGLEILGSSHAEVLGNRFGFDPAGASIEFNGLGRAITIASVPLGPDAVGNVVGTALDPQAAATPACDGGCNLIARAGYSIVLNWEFLDPALDTTIVGNQFGLDVTGTKPVSNGDGVAAGGGAGTVVGGFAPGEGNRLNSGQSAIRGSGAGFLIAGNQIGLDATGTQIMAPPLDGVAIYSQVLSGLADEAIVAGNAIGLDGGYGIRQRGSGATIVGNEIVGAEIGVFTSEDNEGHGSLIGDNLIEGSATVGIMLENDFNEIYGNGIYESGIDGVAIFGRNGLEATGNVIGGDTEESENEISLSGSYAIVIGGVEESQNEVARNYGFLNEGGFIELYTYSPGFEPVGPDGGIEPPEFSASTATGAGGTAEPYATVRVFRKETDEAGEIESFLAEAVADGDGDWTVDYGAIPGGTVVAATQTNPAGGTSELGFATTPKPPELGPGAGPVPPVAIGPRPDVVHLQTKMTKGPKETVRRPTVRFRFSSSEPGSSFQCRLDGGRFRRCGSPICYQDLEPGRHRFEVRAIDAVGNVDPTPAKRIFVVLES